MVAPIGIFFGRIANFINSELIGRATDIPWSVQFVLIDNIKRHPSQLYEAFFEGIILFLLLRYFFKKNYLQSPGKISSLFLIFYSLLCVAILNIIVWTGMKHHISTVFVIGAVITAVSIICLFAISKAIQLQSLSAKHRDFIRNELFIIEEEIWEMKLAGKKEERINDLLSAKALLQQVDESINYKELIYKPTTIFGYAANNGVMGSVLGLILTGFLFAVQGFVSVGIAYNSFGWFIP